MLIASVRVYLPDHLRRRQRTDLNHEGALASVSCFLEAAHIAVGLNMSEDGFCSIEYVLSKFEIEISVKTLDFSLSLLL